MLPSIYDFALLCVCVLLGVCCGGVCILLRDSVIWMVVSRSGLLCVGSRGPLTWEICLQGRAHGDKGGMGNKFKGSTI